MHPLASPFSNRKIVLCVSGGIAAYKSVFLLRALVKAGATVQVAMTQAAQEFVGQLTFQTLSGRPVFTNLFDNRQDAEIGHIRIADGADLIVVAPATANLLSRVQAGMASDPVTAAILAAQCPVLMAPAMNVNMWKSEATRDNVKTLGQRGVHFVGPDEGFLACQWTGSGRLAEPEHIQEACARLLMKQDLETLRVVVTAAGTEEPIDPVRFLGNRSSGKMGFSLALAAARRGAEVSLITGPSDLDTPEGVDRTDVRTAAEMFSAVMAEKKAELVIMAAAVADYRPNQVGPQKRKKDQWGHAPSVALERTEDILATLGSARSQGSPFLVGFAAETEGLAQAAKAKLASKGCDLIVANDVSQSDRGFGSDNNEVLLSWTDGCETLGLASKESIAHSILDRVLQNTALPKDRK